MPTPPLTPAHDARPLDVAHLVLSYRWETDAYRLRVARKVHGSTGFDAVTYEALTIQEALDVICATLEA